MSSSKSTVITVIASSGLASSFRLTAEATAGTGNRARNDLVASGEQLGHNLVITMPNSLSDMKLDISIFDTRHERLLHPLQSSLLSTLVPAYSLFSLICERACGVCPLQRREYVLLLLRDCTDVLFIYIAGSLIRCVMHDVGLVFVHLTLSTTRNADAE